MVFIFIEAQFSGGWWWSLWRWESPPLFTSHNPLKKNERAEKKKKRRGREKYKKEDREKQKLPKEPISKPNWFKSRVEGWLSFCLFFCLFLPLANSLAQSWLLRYYIYKRLNSPQKPQLLPPLWLSLFHEVIMGMKGMNVFISITKNFSSCSHLK